LSFVGYLDLEKGAEGGGGRAPFRGGGNRVYRRLHAYTNLARERDIPDIDIYTEPRYSSRPNRAKSRGLLGDVLSWLAMGEFAVVLDDRAQRWLNEHPNQDALVIAYSDTRC
jgi:hypothetical protein